MTYTVQEQDIQFSRLLDLVEEGEEVVILRHGQPVAQLVAAPKKRKPRLGSMVGKISWQEGWEKPMSDEEADNFLEGKS
jgi:antitoxin (DNA-binding transcriptional repressor) of toxin-antitoxin stability system